MHYMQRGGGQIKHYSEVHKIGNKRKRVRRGKQAPAQLTPSHWKVNIGFHFQPFSVMFWYLTYKYYTGGSAWFWLWMVLAIIFSISVSKEDN